MSVAPIEPPALKRKATSPLTKHQCVTLPTSSPSPTSWNQACNSIRGRARRHISPLVETIPELPSVGRSSERKWVKSPWLLVNDKEPSAALVLTHFHEDLYQQVYIDRSVNNETCPALPTWQTLHGSDGTFNQPSEALSMASDT